MPSVTLLRGPRGVGFGFLLIGSVFLVSRVWDSLSWHARGMILAVTGLATGTVLLAAALFSMASALLRP